MLLKISYKHTHLCDTSLLNTKGLIVICCAHTEYKRLEEDYSVTR